MIEVVIVILVIIMSMLRCSCLLFSMQKGTVTFLLIFPAMSRKLPSLVTSILARHSPSRHNSFHDLKRTIFAQSNADQNHGQDDRSSNNNTKFSRASYYFPVVGIIGAWAGFAIWEKRRGHMEVACEVSTEPGRRETKSQDQLSLQEAVKQSTRLLKNLMVSYGCRKSCLIVYVVQQSGFIKVAI